MATPVTQDLIDVFNNPGPQLEDLLSRLPLDLLYKIVEEYLPSHTIVHLCEVSRYFKDVLCGEQWLWKHLYQQDISELRSLPIPKGATEPDWHTAYVNVIKSIRNMSPYDILKIASKNGYEKLIASEIQSFPFPGGLSMVMVDNAIAGNYLDIIGQLVSLRKTNVNRVMLEAITAGRQEIVNRMIALGANDFNTALKFAVSGGQRAIVDQMIALGANNLDEALQTALLNRQSDMVDYLVSLGANY